MCLSLIAHAKGLARIFILSLHSSEVIETLVRCDKYRPNDTERVELMKLTPGKLTICISSETDRPSE